jgi:tRNA(His) 5'-end guanylyltransferase
MKDIGTRMKENYEDRYRFYLTRRTPVIIRLDGKAFHTLTKNCEKPFDLKFIASMVYTASHLLNNIQGAKVAYIQSDEISILLTDYDNLDTEAWFDYNLQKIVSVSASMATSKFREYYLYGNLNKEALFDARAFNIPRDEVSNYFIWRQQDWIKNSVQMLARAHFSHKDLHGKNQQAMITMLEEKGVRWNELLEHLKNGTFLIKAFAGMLTETFKLTEKGRDFIDAIVKTDLLIEIT